MRGEGSRCACDPARSLHSNQAMLPRGLESYFATRFDSQVLAAEPLAPDDGGRSTAKVDGYGEPMRVTLKRRDGTTWQCVFHTASANEFGHDRRSDRALQQLLAFDTFGTLDRHVAALDVGALANGAPFSIANAGELFLVTEWAEGKPYAADLRRLARGAALEPLDLERARALAAYLGRLHTRLPRDPVRHRRALRDVVGSGEGIFGICDAWPDAYAARLEALETQAVAWRWRLRAQAERLSRIHGDFHPFNVVFREGCELTALDAARGCAGEPADDVTALAVNYVFFAADHPERWAGCFAVLWRSFWETYLEHTHDAAMLSCVGPYLAWRALVVGCPRFYPHLSERARERMLELARVALTAPSFDPAMADGLFR